jgi:hypothetical protein
MPNQFRLVQATRRSATTTRSGHPVSAQFMVASSSQKNGTHGKKQTSANAEFREMKMQPSLERALRHKEEVLKA